MCDIFKNELLMLLNDKVDDDTLINISNEIDIILVDYDINRSQSKTINLDDIKTLIDTYFMTLKIRGLSKGTTSLYSLVLNSFFETVQKELEDITSKDIRGYLSKYQREHKVCNRTLSSRKTIICTFFKWLASEGYIPNNPAENVHAIKYNRIHKQAMTQLDLEKIRLACKTKREKAIIEVLYSTACRVSELSALDIADVDFETKEVTLLGKGNQYRTSFLNAKAEVALKDYLDSRTDDNEALFVYQKEPYDRLAKSGIENIVKNIMSRTSDMNVHVTPHIFRHTTATTALDRGMNIADVSKFLGHKSIATTMEYITTNLNSIKEEHKTCIV